MKGNKSKSIRVKSAILSGVDGCSLGDIIDSDQDAFKGVRMLYSTDNSGVNLQLNKSLQNNFSGIFAKSRLLAYSDSIRSEMESGSSTICFKQRALFDTNLLSDLPKYFKGEEISTGQRVEDILVAVEQEFGGGFDFSFPMLENLREYTRENNPHPVNKVSAAIYFDYKLRNRQYASVGNEDIFKPYHEQAESVWMNFRSSKDVWSAIDRRDLIYAVMLKTYQLCWAETNITIENALFKLVDYCLKELGVLPLKELYFAWKVVIGFSLKIYTPAFDEKSLKSPDKNTINRISALAWDLFIFRFTETLLTEEKGNTFYIPTITTLDKGLLDTVVSCPVRAMISFPEQKYVETIFDDEMQFQQCLNNAMSERQKQILSSSDRGIRGNKKLRHYITLSIVDLEKSIKNLSI